MRASPPRGLLALWRDQLFDPPGLLLPDLSEPCRDGTAPQVAGDPRPPPRLGLRGADGERDDLHSRQGTTPGAWRRWRRTGPARRDQGAARRSPPWTQTPAVGRDAGRPRPG